MITPQEIMDLPTLPQNPREYVVLMRGRPLIAITWAELMSDKPLPKGTPGPLIRTILTTRQYKDAVSAGERMVVLEER